MEVTIHHLRPEIKPGMLLRATLDTQGYLKGDLALVKSRLVTVATTYHFRKQEDLNILLSPHWEIVE